MSTAARFLLIILLAGIGPLLARNWGQDGLFSCRFAPESRLYFRRTSSGSFATFAAIRRA